MANKQQSFIDRTIATLLLVIFGGIIVHAPLTVWLSTMFAGSELFIKSWKEMLLLVAALLTVVQLTRLHLWREIMQSTLLRLIGVIGAFDVLLVLLVNNLPVSELAGLLIGLRYYLYFGLVYIHLYRFPALKALFVRVFLGGALLVAVFSMLQVFVLPKDALSVIGYSDVTIKPYLTVDLNHDYIRINSTFRGPNPLGAYAVIVLSFLGALILRRKWPTSRRQQILLGVIGVGMLVSLWWSYSRSAFVGAFVAAIMLVAAAGVVRTLSKKMVLRLAAVLAVCFVAIAAVAATQSEMISNVVFHTNTQGGSAKKSDDGHRSSLERGTAGVIAAPLGHGIGSSGSASLLSDKPNIVENQYIATAWQSGVLGLGLTIWLFIGVMVAAWKRRRDALQLAVFASGAGMAVIGLVLPVWTDDTVSIVWWGLAAIVLGVAAAPRITKGARRGKTSN